VVSKWPRETAENRAGNGSRRTPAPIRDQGESTGRVGKLTSRVLARSQRQKRLGCSSRVRSWENSLRTSIARACRDEAIPLFSPHDLRHRRTSLLHDQGRSWAEIGAYVGQRSLKVTADTYTHVIVDGREIDVPRLLAEVA
jgi:integrase